MIGYYVHHQGRGHAHRAAALAGELDYPLTGLSSLSRPAAWQGHWVRLVRDDTSARPEDVTAGGQLHWAPERDGGLRKRMAAVSAWIDRMRPQLMVVDVSCEVALLARLHGVPVVYVVLPGRRVDATHLLAFRASTALVAMWPPGLPGMTPGLPQDVAERLHCVGGLSRFAGGDTLPSARTTHRAVLLLGAGGGHPDLAQLAAAAAQTPGWEWTVLGHPQLGWSDDPFRVVSDADVVVTQGGQNAVAEVAAARRPAVVIPAPRPFDEQAATCSVLRSGGWPAVVVPSWPDRGWHRLLEQAHGLDGRAWDTWCDGRAAGRFADLLTGLLADQPAIPRDAARR